MSGVDLWLVFKSGMGSSTVTVRCPGCSDVAGYIERGTDPENAHRFEVTHGQGRGKLVAVEDAVGRVLWPKDGFVHMREPRDVNCTIDRCTRGATHRVYFHLTKATHLYCGWHAIDSRTNQPRWPDHVASVSRI